MKKSKDDQFLKALELNGRLQSLGNNLVLAIEKYGKYSKYGMSPNMKKAISGWKENLANNYNKVP